MKKTPPKPHLMEPPTGGCVDGETTLCGVPVVDLTRSDPKPLLADGPSVPLRRNEVCRSCWREHRAQIRERVRKARSEVA